MSIIGPQIWNNYDIARLVCASLEGPALVAAARPARDGLAREAVRRIWSRELELSEVDSRLLAVIDNSRRATYRFLIRRLAVDGTDKNIVRFGLALLTLRFPHLFAITVRYSGRPPFEYRYTFHHDEALLGSITAAVSLVPLASTHQNEALESFYDAIDAANDLVPESWMLKRSRRGWIVSSLYDLQQCLMEADTCDIRFAQLIISPDHQKDISQLLDQDMLRKLGFPELTISTSVIPPIQFAQRPGEMTIPRLSDTLFILYQMSGDVSLHELRVRVHDVKGVIPLLARRADLLARFRHVVITFDHSALVHLHSIGVSLNDPPAPPSPGAVRRLRTMTIKVHDTGLLLREREGNRHDRLLANTAWIRHIAKFFFLDRERACGRKSGVEHYETELHRLLAAILAERKALGGHTALGWRRT